jgi:deoxyribodipyrimidine photo-lyase
MTELVWLRNDLRLLDNPALYHACQSDCPIKVVYCTTALQWEEHNESPAQLALRQALLVQLGHLLSDKGITLDVLHTCNFEQLPNQILQYCLANNIQGLWFNKQNWLNEKIRDKHVVQLLNNHNIVTHRFDDEMLVNSDILSIKGSTYRVFTPWYKQWLKVLSETNIQLLPSPKSDKPSASMPSIISLPLATNYRADLWPANHHHAINRLIHFCDKNAKDYELNRNFPAINGTSLLSPYIAVGAISIRQCYIYLKQACLKHQFSLLEHTWLKELAWREFYRYLMMHNPDLAKGIVFNADKEPQWINNTKHLTAWQQGRTGFPIIDAAMLQLENTGWMHNRLRMLTASFLCKLLLIDWRKGEAHFMEHLIDGDFSSNNGGWQWSASVGCDAAPWFRIFNPTTQSKKFDKNGEFIRKMLPQLNQLNDRDIHCPSAEQRKQLNYPSPIIDYASSRKRALNWNK